MFTWYINRQPRNFRFKCIINHEKSTRRSKIQGRKMNKIRKCEKSRESTRRGKKDKRLTHSVLRCITNLKCKLAPIHMPTFLLHYKRQTYQKQRHKKARRTIQQDACSLMKMELIIRKCLIRSRLSFISRAKSLCHWIFRCSHCIVLTSTWKIKRGKENTQESMSLQRRKWDACV